MARVNNRFLVAAVAAFSFVLSSIDIAAQNDDYINISDLSENSEIEKFGEVVSAELRKVYDEIEKNNPGLRFMKFGRLLTRPHPLSRIELLRDEAMEQLALEPAADRGTIVRKVTAEYADYLRARPEYADYLRRKSECSAHESIVAVQNNKSINILDLFKNPEIGKFNQEVSVALRKVCDEFEKNNPEVKFRKSQHPCLAMGSLRNKTIEQAALEPAADRGAIVKKVTAEYADYLKGELKYSAHEPIVAAQNDNSINISDLLKNLEIEKFGEEVSDELRKVYDEIEKNNPGLRFMKIGRFKRPHPLSRIRWLRDKAMEQAVLEPAVDRGTIVRKVTAEYADYLKARPEYVDYLKGKAEDFDPKYSADESIVTIRIDKCMKNADLFKNSEIESFGGWVAAELRKVYDEFNKNNPGARFRNNRDPFVAMGALRNKAMQEVVLPAIAREAIVRKITAEYADYLKRESKNPDNIS